MEQIAFWVLPFAFLLTKYMKDKSFVKSFLQISFQRPFSGTLETKCIDKLKLSF